MASGKKIWPPDLSAAPIYDGARWGSALRAGVKVLLGISLTVDGQTMVLTIGIPTIGPFRSAHVRKLI